MIFILQRYIFRELMKVFALSTIALTLMLSLGSILRPVQEYGIGPGQVIHLMGYFLPITLTFVLPMAALFASTLVYGRFASDNELDACRASGISFSTLVYPGLVLAIMVAIANLILSFHVMPAFVLRAEKSLKADAQKILFRNVQRKGYYKLPPDGQYLIYADQANPESGTLSGVIVIDAKGAGISKIITAESARVQFNPHDRFNEVQIIASKTYQMGTEDEGGFYAELLPITTEFGTLLTDNIKFKKIDEMKKIQVDPMRFYPIEKLARQTYAQLIIELLAQDIINTTANNTNLSYKLHSDKKLVNFTADQYHLRDEKKIELLGNVTIKEYDADTKQPLRTLQCTKALLHLEGDEIAPTLTMDLYSPTWKDVNGLEGLSRRQIIRGLILPGSVKDKSANENILEVVNPVSGTLTALQIPSVSLSNLQNVLQRKIQRTLVKIKAEINFRLAFGVGCVSLIMIGIGLGVILKGGHLLVAFGTSCVPAALLLVCLMMGKNITKNPESEANTGIIIMWGGVLFLSFLAIGVYRKLLKN